MACRRSCAPGCGRCRSSPRSRRAPRFHECFLTIRPPCAPRRGRILEPPEHEMSDPARRMTAMSHATLLRPWLFAILLCGQGLAQAADLSKAAILVAKPELHDELFGSTILVVAPVGEDRHVG